MEAAAAALTAVAPPDPAWEVPTPRFNEEVSSAPTLPATPSVEPALPAAPSVEPAPPAAPSPTTTKSPKRLWGKGIVAACALVAVVGITALSRRPAAPLAAPGVRVACPPLDARTPLPDPDGWLGAAASSLACRQLALWMGGDPTRVVPPAQLLGLPPGPSAAADPFGEVGARARAVAAAGRATLRLDGSVVHDGAGFTVDLALRDPQGRAVAQGRAESPRFAEAVARATDALARGGGLRDGALTPEGRAWTGGDRASEAIAFSALERAEDVELLRAACESLRASDGAFGRLAPIARIECAFKRMLPPQPPLPVSRSTPADLARTARYHVVSGGSGDPAEFARSLQDAARGAPPWVASVLREAEAEMWHTQRDTARAVATARVAVELWPGNTLAWGRLVSLSLDAQDAAETFRGAAAWMPEAASSWRWLAELPAGAAVDTAPYAAMAARAYLLAPASPTIAAVHGRWLTQRGDRGGARAVAARMLAIPSPAARFTGEVLGVGVDASAANFSTALRAAERALDGEEALALGAQYLTLVETTLELAAILGRRAEVADHIVARFIDPTPRLGRFGAGAVMALAVCGSASPAVAPRCLARIDALVAAQHFFALLPSYASLREGVGRYIAGDAAGATAAWRRLVRDGRLTLTVLHALMVDAFDRADEPELADRLDAELQREALRWGGATLAHARAAGRAQARGDVVRARALASTVVEAWATAEGSPPEVRAMRALLRGP
jgi:hypothetical protein